MDPSYIIHGGKGRGEATMDTEDLIGHQGGYRKGVEDVDKGPPDLDAHPSLAFIVESVDTGDIGAFVVASKEEEIVRELDLVAQE